MIHFIICIAIYLALAAFLWSAVKHRPLMWILYLLAITGVLTGIVILIMTIGVFS